MSQPWLIDPRYKEELECDLEAASNQKEAYFSEERDPLDDYRFEVVNGDTAIIPVRGYISHKYSWWSCGTSCEVLIEVIDKLINLPQIKKIILDINSPGGSVGGVEQLAEFIFQSRSKKKIIAYVNTLAASAAYWIASACSEIYVSESSAEVGSIGVILVHFSYQGYLEQEGIKTTHIQSSKHKSLGTPYRDLGEDEKAIIKEDIDAIFEVFVNSVSKYRGISSEEIIAMEALTFMDKKAQTKGLTDGKKSINELLKEVNDEEEVEDQDEEEVEEDEEEEEAEGDDNEEEAESDDEEKEAQQAAYERKLIKKGQKLERDRQEMIRKLTVPGMEKFMEKYICDGKTSPEKALVFQTRKIQRNAEMGKFSADNPGIKTQRIEESTSTSKDLTQKEISESIPKKWRKEGHETLGELLNRD